MTIVQGMAFVAGVILMYLPEEPAFRVLCQLLDEGGVGLRTLYLPGLSGLKEELRMLDWLMERLMPNLKQHLEVTFNLVHVRCIQSCEYLLWLVHVCCVYVRWLSG